MIETMKDTTIYLYFKDTESLPFPDLDKIGQQLIPFYDFKESIMIDTEIVSLIQLLNLYYSGTMTFRSYRMIFIKSWR
jgi:hypothetical protein